MIVNNEKAVIALIGNPNCGKTTIFNAFTGSKQYVGNWPGVTVEKKIGHFIVDDYAIEVVDLPGIYSLTTYSLDEKISRNFLLNEKPILVVNIIDATNLERNLYLTIQLLQMKIPVLIALNMMDIVDKMGIEIKINKMAISLNCPIIPLSASKKEGLENLKSEILKKINQTDYDLKSFHVPFDSVLEESIQKIESLTHIISDKHNYNSRWFSLKLLENDEQMLSLINFDMNNNIHIEREKILKHTRNNAELVIADGIYGFIHGFCREIIKRKIDNQINLSDKIDRYALNSLLGLPIFVFIMYILFSFSITLSQPFIGLLDNLFGGFLVNGFSEVLKSINSPDWLILILANGIGGGIQTVSTFIPPIFFIFLFLSLLEDSGYMARAAFVMDRFMRLLGLSGKSIIPMIVGFGCTVPAIMAARTLENRRDQVMTILLVPFIQCGAKIPVYSMFALLFFGHNAGIVIFSLYFIGIIFALMSGFLFKKFIFKGKISDFVMELPSYHIPTLNGIFTHTWFKLKGFTFRAGKTIIFVIILLTLINSLNIGYNEQLKRNETILTISGRIVTPLFKPMGIDQDNWGATVALFTGLFAKEAIIGTLNAIHLTEKENDNINFNLKDHLIDSMISFKNDLYFSFSRIINPFMKQEMHEIDVKSHPLRKTFKNVHQVIAYLLFIVIYAPCIAAISTVNKEVGFKVSAFQVVYLTLMAWVVSVFYYQATIHNLNSLTYYLIGSIIITFLIIYMNHLKLENEV